MPFPRAGGRRGPSPLLEKKERRGLDPHLELEGGVNLPPSLFERENAGVSPF